MKVFTITKLFSKSHLAQDHISNAKKTYWNTKLKATFLMLLLFFITGIVPAQYHQSGGLLTINDNTFLWHQEYSVGALSGNGNYAVSHQQTYFNGNSCSRKLSYFDGLGNFIASSSNYSHDHHGGTKILFDPKDDNVVFALYRERVNQTNQSLGWKTYIKRMELQNGGVLEGPRVEVFDHSNSVDMEVVTNSNITDLIITGVMDDGSVQVKVFREFFISSQMVLAHAATVTIAGSGSAYVTPSGNAGVWSLDSDMKGNELVVAYNTGTYNYESPFNVDLKVHRLQFNVFGAALNQTGNFVVGNSRLYTQTNPSSNIKQAIGLRSNGEILFLRQSGTNAFDLIKLGNGNTPVQSTLGSGTGHAHLVVASNNRAFVARRPSTSQIDLYNEHDALVKTYSPSWELSPGLNNLSVLDCRLLAVGKYDTNLQFHEFYNCSDCNGGFPSAEMEYVNPNATIFMSSFYGLQPVAAYCRMNDVYVDGSASTCENGFHLSIWEFDLANWNTTNVLYSGWVPGSTTVPHNLKIADYLPNGFVPGIDQVYLVRIAVGSNWSYVNKFFKLNYCTGRPVDEMRKTTHGYGANWDNKKDWGGKVIPNPNRGSFQLKVEGMGSEPIEVAIMNSMGQQIKSLQTYPGITKEFDLKLTAGMYFIRMQRGDQNKVLKFFVQ